MSYKCPECGCTELKITIKSEILVDFEENGDHEVLDTIEGDQEWDHDSRAECSECGYTKTLDAFEVSA